MYIDIVPNRSSPPAILLRESFREGNRVRKRTIANLSKWPENKVQALQAILRDEIPGSTSSLKESKQDREQDIGTRYSLVQEHLNEKQRRLFAATEAMVCGEGGISLVARATGISRITIRRGIRDLEGKDKSFSVNDRVRREGSGRKTSTEKYPKLQEDLDTLLEPVTRGDPTSPLRWSCKSLRRLSDELKKLGHKVSYQVVRDQLRILGYSLQSNRKVREGANHPDRNAQFEHINGKVEEYLSSADPVISVDTKKKEKVGDFKNNGREWLPKGEPEEVRVHDFIIPELGKAVPYGVYDIGTNSGWVSVGTDHDTASFAVQTIRNWWKAMGRKEYTSADRLLITADAGGSNGPRVRLWKIELQNFANELGIPISVCHFPPGTSKWNKIEHKLFSFITMNWRGKPLVSHEVIVKLIARTKTATGLRVKARIDRRRYPKGQKITDKELANVNMSKDDFHGEWNYTIHPGRN